MHKPIVIAGSINFDFIVDVAALPKPNETLMGKQLKTAVGGKGLNQAVACAALGAATAMIGAVGDDAIATQTLSHLSVHGVNTDHVRAVAGVATGIANIFVAEGGDNMIVVTPGANGRLSPGDIDVAQDLIAGASALIVQLEVPLPTVRRALEIARRHNVLTVINPAPVDMSALDLLPLADLVTPNETELMRLTGITSFSDADLVIGLETLQTAGARQALVTLGRDGCAALIDGQLVRQPAYIVKAVDAVGAGDVFNGALVSRLVTDPDLPAAMRFATAAAALSVTRASADAAPSAADVEAFLAANPR